MLVVYDVAHSLPIEGVGGGLPFTEDVTRRHFSYLSGTFRQETYKSMLCDKAVPIDSI